MHYPREGTISVLGYICTCVKIRKARGLKVKVLCSRVITTTRLYKNLWCAAFACVVKFCKCYIK